MPGMQLPDGRIVPLHQYNAEMQKIRGLGDLVARATSAIGIKACSPCEERQRRLNALFPNPFNRGR